MEFFCLITTHDRPNLLECAISSALNQVVHFSKIVVVIDGEPTKYKAIIDKYESDEFLDLIEIVATGTPMGANYARNLAVITAKHAAIDDTIICFLDDDDEFFRTKTESLKEIFSKDLDLDICYDALEIHYPELSLSYVRMPKYHDEQIIAETNFIGPTSGVSLRLCRIGAERIFDESLSMLQDWDCWIGLLLEKGLKYHPNKIITTRYNIWTTQSTSKQVSDYPTAYMKLGVKWLNHEAFENANIANREAEYYSIFGWKLLHSNEPIKAAGMYLKAFQIMPKPRFILKAMSSIFGLRISIIVASTIGKMPLVKIKTWNENEAQAKNS